MSRPDFEYKQYEGVPGFYRGTITYTVDGYLGQNTYDVQVYGHEMPYALVCCVFERDLIEEGFDTHECGCCVCDSGVDIIDYSVVPVKP